MQHNPYSPPAAELSNPSFAAPVKKPKSAWLIQIISSIVVVLLTIGLANDFIAIVFKNTLRLATISPQRLFIFMALRMMILILFIMVVWGVQQRKLYGRICGCLVIAAMLAWFVYQLLFVNSKASMNGAAALGEFTAKMLFSCGAGYWFYAFGFSPKALRYFSTDYDDAQIYST